MVQSAPVQPPTPPQALRLPGPSGGRSDDVGVIRRLLRDVFRDLLTLKQRVRALEPRGARESALADARAAAALRRRFALLSHARRSRSAVQHSHALDLRGGVHRLAASLALPLEEQRSEAGPALHSHLSAQLDTDSRVDLRVLTCDGGVSLLQGRYQRMLGESTMLTLSPFGGRFGDTASSLHPSPGKGRGWRAAEGASRP